MEKQFKLTDEQIIKILLDGSYVESDDVKKAEDFAKKYQKSVLDYFLSQEIINEDLFGQAVAEFFGVSYADLNTLVPSAKQVATIPENVARKYRVVLFSEAEGGVEITTDNPRQKELAVVLKNIFPKKKIKISYSLSEDINAILSQYRKPLDTRFAKIINTKNSVAPEIIDEIIDDALFFRSSDIHFEPKKEEVVVRFRVDGILREAGKIPIKYYENILNMIKVQARLRIDDHFSAQDGSIRVTKKDRNIDLRISIVPTLSGEKIVVRVLADYVRSLAVSDIGFSANDQDVLEKSSKKPFGMILVTGPTGSGKTTTLYSLLRQLNRPEVNIMTIEDPVEYQITEINQIQVNVQTNLNFAKGLRSIVRQDPDIILVGEIRDEETAEIAVNAALTGHLLLSTFHANDAATAIPRLLDMKIEPFLLASTLDLVIAQRLVRKVCDKCRYSFSMSQKEIKENFSGAETFFGKNNNTFYKGKGCDNCNHSGYIGRIAIFELIQISKEMQDLILKNPSSNQIWEIARAQGSKTLFEDGVEKVKRGITTLEELYRVAAPPEKIRLIK